LVAYRSLRTPHVVLYCIVYGGVAQTPETAQIMPRGAWPFLVRDLSTSSRMLPSYHGRFRPLAIITPSESKTISSVQFHSYQVASNQLGENYDDLSSRLYIRFHLTLKSTCIAAAATLRLRCGVKFFRPYRNVVRAHVKLVCFQWEVFESGW
jgi:hypothetical protein